MLNRAQSIGTITPVALIIGKKSSSGTAASGAGVSAEEIPLQAVIKAMLIRVKIIISVFFIMPALSFPMWFKY
jgi:hypothetical protein